MVAASYAAFILVRIRYPNNFNTNVSHEYSRPHVP